MTDPQTKADWEDFNSTMNPTIKAYLSQIGRKGGSAGQGESKRRKTSGKLAADARWAKRKQISR